MATNTKMLQMLIDGQAKIRSDIKGMRVDFGKLETNLTARIDKLGLQIASLEDDAPTVEEFDKLTKRVTKVEHKLGLN